MLKDVEFANSLYFDYENFIEPSIKSRRFRQSDILPLINSLDKEIFKVDSAGFSVEGREIFSIAFGTGKIRVLCWSQMHGDESTATMALFDILNFFSENDHYSPTRKNLLAHLKVIFLPMLNPDGAEIFSRRNKAGIDINRDAVKLVSPEANILSRYAKEFRPHFAFNLHDQDTHYTAGNCFKSAAISFLAPPLDIEKSTDNTRLGAIKLISRLFRMLSVFIPGHIGKYTDDFEPRAFGDNIQAQGSSTILIESGGWKDDSEKQFLRKLNFIILLFAFRSISEESYKSESVETYEKIPFNETYLFDLLLKDLTYCLNDKEYLIDVGINFEEKTCRDGKTYFREAKIADIGDLSVFFGHEEVNLKGYTVSPGKTSAGIYNLIEDISPEEFTSLLNAGYTNIKLMIPPVNMEFSPIPLNMITSGKNQDKDVLAVDECPNFIISKEGEVKYAVVNGCLIQPDNPFEEFRNALIL